VTIAELTGPAPVTSSVGVAEVLAGHNLATSINLADKAMLQAKTADRNRIILQA
jgi:PleD family two-component response regulator